MNYVKSCEICHVVLLAVAEVCFCWFISLLVSQSRQVFRGTEEGTEKTETTEDSKVPLGETTGDGGFNAVKASAASVFRKAGDLREGLRHRLDKSEKQAFWHLPSTSANYVQLNLNPEASEASDAVNRVKKLGGKLKGSIAKKGREVANLAHDIRQRHAIQRSESKEVKNGQSTDELNLGDSIFAIGSDEEDWSDGWEAKVVSVFFFLMANVWSFVVSKHADV